MSVSADLFEESRKGTPLAVDHPTGGLRPVGGVWPHPEGIVFADAGWDSPAAIGGHTFHLVEGKFDPQRWRIGEADFFVVEMDDPLFAEEAEEILTWRAWQKEAGKDPVAVYDRGGQIALEAFRVD